MNNEDWARDDDGPPLLPTRSSVVGNIHSVPLPILRTNVVKDRSRRAVVRDEESGYDLSIISNGLLSRHRNALCSAHKLVAGQQVSEPIA